MSNNILFTTKYGLVQCEYTSFEGDNNFLRDFYRALINSYSKNAENYLWGNDQNSISFFYSYYRVYISYTPFKDVAIMYALYSYDNDN